MKRSIRYAVLLVLVATMTILSACSVNISNAKKADLSEWSSDSAALSSLKSYVSASVNRKSDGFIPEKDRIAVFDMDGTLTCETFFTYFDTCMFIEYCLVDHPERVSEELKDAARAIKPGYKADEALARNFAKAYAGLTVEELYDYAVEFGNKKTPSFNNMRYFDGLYLPMAQVVKYLYENGYTIYVVSGTERTTSRAIIANSPISEYVHPDHIIGTEFEVKVKGYEDVPSNMDYKYENGNELVYTGGFIQKNLNANKSIWIQREIGQRPVLAFGNTPSDFSMLNYTLDERNPYPTQAYMVVADDDAREWGTQKWDEKSKEYKDLGYIPVSMKNDFVNIYPSEVTKSDVQYTDPEAGTTDNKDAADSTVSEHTVGDYSQKMTDDTADQFKDELSAFEIAAEQRKRAAKNTAGYDVLDAGRGNPNWINSKVRSAFSRLMDFANEECQLVMDKNDMAMHGNSKGISDRFDKYMNPSDEVDKFLIDAVDHCVNKLGMNKDDLLFELTNGIIGDYYPEPSRCLALSEQILYEYIESALFGGNKPDAETDIFPTEGGSAAMCYIFHSLSHNKILKPGDKIAIGTPIFTPYLEIPNVNNYGLVSIDISADREHGWDIDPKELDKLRDKDIKAFFLVNPSNPASHALSKKTLEQLKDIVHDNPDLIILTDDVYGTFVEGFETVYSAIPDNTILVYSFSKLYGVTGWRTGLIAMSRNNVVDRLISELPDEDRKALEEEYSIAVSDPDKMKFIERLTADSRSIGLYHTSGLSTPSQIFMDLMALSHTTYEKDPYIAMANSVVNERYHTLMNALGIKADDSSSNARYYALIDINALITDKYDEDFAKWKEENISDIDFLNDLAEKKGVVLMYGPGFDAPEGNVRVSLANLNNDDYKEIASRIMELLDEYHQEYENAEDNEALDDAA